MRLDRCLTTKSTHIGPILSRVQLCFTGLLKQRMAQFGPKDAAVPESDAEVVEPPKKKSLFGRRQTGYGSRQDLSSIQEYYAYVSHL